MKRPVVVILAIANAFPGSEAVLSSSFVESVPQATGPGVGGAAPPRET